MSTLSELRVTQSNRLIEAAHTLTLNEKRLVLAAASQLDPRKPPPSAGFLTIRASDFAAVFGIDEKHAYEAMDEAATRLYHRDVRIYERPGKVKERFRWVYHVKYHNGLGKVILGFSPSILPYLTLLHREFTTYQLKQVGALPSFYAIRMYELLTQFRKTGERLIALERLREVLDLGEKYRDVKNLRVRVLEPSLREINTHTDLSVTWTLQRNGRKVIGVRFLIEENKQGQLDLASNDVEMSPRHDVATS